MVSVLVSEPQTRLRQDGTSCTESKVALRKANSSFASTRNFASSSQASLHDKGSKCHGSEVRYKRGERAWLGQSHSSYYPYLRLGVKALQSNSRHRSSSSSRRRNIGWNKRRGRKSRISSCSCHKAAAAPATSGGTTPCVDVTARISTA